MVTYRTTARVVGGLFIVATAAGLLAVGVAPPAGDADGGLVAIADQADRAATAALLELAMGMAVAAIAIAAYPVLRQASGRLAIGFIASRTAEGVMSVLSAIAGLTLLSIGRELVAGGGADTSLQALGAVVQSARDWVNLALLPVVFAVSAVLFNGALFGARLVPRWLSGWGLLGAFPYLAWGLLTLYGQQDLGVLAAPLGLQEMALAVWLLVRGFNVAALEPERDVRRATRQAVPGPLATPATR